MRDFIVEFLKYVKFHGQFMEGVTNDVKLSIAKQILPKVIWEERVALAQLYNKVHNPHWLQ